MPEGDLGGHMVLQCEAVLRPRRRLCAPLALVLVALAAAIAASPGAGATGRTGRYLVVFKRASAARAAAAGPRLVGRLGLSPAGRGVPALGVLTVRGPHSALRALERDPRVASVSPEYRRQLRRAPNDPALTTPETAFGGLPGGGPIQWYLVREGFPAAWSVTTGAGAIVGVIDTGLDGDHPELAGKVASAAELGSSTGALHDADGHGTHVSGLACAATNDGVGTAGAGWGCRLVVVKAPQLRDADVIDGIVLAVDRGAQAINMSFGGGPPSAAIDAAIDYAVSHKVILVAAASDFPDTDQGSPANQLQPNDASTISAGRGLVVTGAEVGGRRADTGFGPQISLAAYGFAGASGPPGIISTYPHNLTPRETGSPACGCRRSLFGDDGYAYLEGTSMAAPQVAALAALVGALNPALTAGEKMRVIKQTARRAGGWNANLGWGIIDAGRALDAARRIDRYPPVSKARARPRVRVRRGRRGAAVRVRWSRADPPGHAGLLPSGVRWVDLYARRGHGRYRAVRRRSRRRSALLRLPPGVYRLYTRATDWAGNHERRPRRDERLVVGG
jgi:subtilisin family serine protease